MENSFLCPVCLDICNRPVEVDCCSNLFCKSCVIQLNTCALCRRDFSYKESVLASRLIAQIKWQCPHCEENLTRGGMQEHLDKCEKPAVSCPICKSTEFIKGNLFSHIIDMHKVDLMKSMTCLLDVLNQNHQRDKAATGSQNGSTSHDADLYCINSQRNSLGNNAKLGLTGKYYCGQQLDGPKCRCCNGYCGPTNGCNCSSCMRLDVKSRRLPQGWLVNRAGFAAKKQANGKFYCGRISDAASNESCGPTTGPNCEACRKLDKMSDNRYIDI